MSDKAEEDAKQNTKEGQKLDPPPPKDETATTEHTTVIAGQEIRYTATAGTYVLKDDEGKAKASIFYVAYTRQGVTDPASRPLTFSFNGGPGSSSVWMHLGMLGPRSVVMNEDGTVPPPPYRLQDNAHSLLDQTDLVFIDPVSTGYSRPAPGEKAKEFHGVEKDVESVGEFIRLWVTRSGRWASPKFLIGESYGTTRAAALSGHLQDRYGMYLNGLMLISVVLDFSTLRFTPGHDLPYILYLPTYAATAWYHSQLAPEMQTDLSGVLEEAQALAAGPYTLALFQGSRLSPQERAELAAQIARLTGLNEAYVARTDLRIEHVRFAKELLREEGLTIGRLDSRFTGRDRDSAGEHFERDPSHSAIHGLYSSTLNDYVRRELAFESDLPYEILTSLYQSWDYSQHANKFLNVAETLRQAMTANPHLKVFVASGYYDMATPYFATEYTMNHLGIADELVANISYGYYTAGHMMYVHPPSLAQIKEDLTAFIAGSSPSMGEIPAG